MVSRVLIYFNQHLLTYLSDLLPRLCNLLEYMYPISLATRGTFILSAKRKSENSPRRLMAPCLYPIRKQYSEKLFNVRGGFKWSPSV